MTHQEFRHTLDIMTQRIVARFNPDRIVLFGSRARGAAIDDSDVDLLIVMPLDGSPRQAARAIDAELADRMIPVDLLVLTPEQFERQKRSTGTIASEADREGIVLYERAA